MTEIWLVRHGQTDWNLNRMFQGQVDIPLNETGIAQAHAFAASLDGTHFNAIYSSDLSRAYQTAQIIAETQGLPVITDPRLREINQGVWEGLTWDEVHEKYQPDFSPNPRYVITPRAEGAESLETVVRRMLAAANEYHEKHKSGRILFATHGLSAASLYLVANQKSLIDAGRYIPENGQPLVIHMEQTLPLPDFSVYRVE